MEKTQWLFQCPANLSSLPSSLCRHFQLLVSGFSSRDPTCFTTYQLSLSQQFSNALGYNFQYTSTLAQTHKQPSLWVCNYWSWQFVHGLWRTYFPKCRQINGSKPWIKNHSHPSQRVGLYFPSFLACVANDSLNLNYGSCSSRNIGLGTAEQVQYYCGSLITMTTSSYQKTQLLRKNNFLY